MYCTLYFYTLLVIDDGRVNDCTVAAERPMDREASASN